MFIAGQVAVDRHGALVGGDDLVGQARQVFANLSEALKSESLTFGNVVKFNTYLVGAANIPKFMNARRELFEELYPNGKCPPNTLVVVERPRGEGISHRGRSHRRELGEEIHPIGTGGVRESLEESTVSASQAAAVKSDVRPMTGKQYLESLKDDREVYIYGERVKDVTVHPAFRNTARMVARMYDALHDPATKDVITCPTDTGNGGFTHRFFRVPRTVEEVIGDRDAIAQWAKISYGWMGRSPDYKASFTGTLGANSEFYKPYQQNSGEVVQAHAGTGPLP